MAKKKDKRNTKGSFTELIKKIWLPIIGFIGAGRFIYDSIQIWKGDAQTLTWIFAVLGLAVWLLFLGWFSFGKGTAQPWRQVARIGLIITFALLIIGIVGWRHQQQLTIQENQNKVIVVITQFDGPEETYGLRSQILEELNNSLGGDKDIKIIPVNETVTIAQGSDYARQLGKQHQADIVIWAWYRPTENPNLTLHIENLSPSKFVVLPESETYKPQASIEELQSFSLQQKIGQQTSTVSTID